MRTLFLLLVLANLAFYAYAFVARERGPARSAAELQISADRVRIVKPAVDKTSSGPSACLEWGVMAGAEIARAEAALARLELPTGSMHRVLADATGYWVHIPPLKSKAELDRRMGELRSFGITDFSAVQDASLGRNAISLGIFSTEDAAQGRLAMLKEKGVRSAVMEARQGIIKQARFLVRDPGKDVVARFAELQREFPGSQIRAGPCPAIDAAKG
jgi:hypothetical protein